ncbi:hypothetical protein ACET3Z_013220 [Daucus carota]
MKCLKTVRIVLFYNVGFVTPKLTGVKEYVGNDTMERIRVEVEKLSVRYIRNMFECVVGDQFDKLCVNAGEGVGEEEVGGFDQVGEGVGDEGTG